MIQSPAHLAGIVGVVYGPEVPNGEQKSQRWLIQVWDNFGENIMVSLDPTEFQVLRSEEQK